MKAHEVLKAYADGRRDFSGENLRGQSFKDKNLCGANFSAADIRGADFTNAKLIDADFKGAKAGLQHGDEIALVIFSWILSALSGIFSLFLGLLITVAIFSSSLDGISGWLSLIVLLVFMTVTIRKGLVAGMGAFAVAVGVAGTFAGAVAFAISFFVAISVAFTFAIAIALTFAFAFTGSESGEVAVAFAFMLFSAYISRRALSGDERDAWIRNFAIAFAATGGTSFGNANLTNADFTSAILKNTDFRNATLTRTNLHQTKKLDYARVANTILIDAKVRDLIVTHWGANQSYLGCNFKGANLIGANLNDANLTEADISGATLERAWLERANLTKTQALNTNFHEANLTGACLESWNINSTTQLDAAICNYVYLLNNQKERRPNSGEFAPGEFTKLSMKRYTNW